MPLSLQAASAVVAGHRNPYRPDPELMAYQRDLLAPYGVRFCEEPLRAGPNIDFVELAERAIAAMPGPAPDPDMVIVTYGLPDCQPLKTVSSYLDHLLGGDCRSFAVSEQGLRAPFTALRVADAYARSGRCRTLALFVLEQTTFPYREPLVDEHALTDSGVLLVFGDGGALRFAEARTGAPGESLSGLLRAVTDPAVTGADGETLVVAGPWTDVDLPAGVACQRVAPGSYCTSVWRDLAHHHQAWAARYARVVLCDADPRSGHSVLAVLERE
jgi:hypothetical protein